MILRNAPTAAVVGMLVGAVTPVLPALMSSVGVLWLVCWVLIGYCISLFGIISIGHHGSAALLLSQNHQGWAALSRNRDLVLSLLGRQSLLLMILSTALIGPTLPAVVWGMQPLVWTYVLNSSGNGWACSDRSWKAFGLGFLGCAITVLAQPADLRGDGALLLVGSLLAVGATLADGCGSSNLAWGARVARFVPRSEPDNMTLTAALCVNLVSSFGVLALALSLALLTHNPLGDTSSALASLAFGFISASATYAWRKCGVMSRNTGVFVIGSGMPAVSTIYAAALGLLTEINLGWLLAGVALVTGASVIGAAASSPRQERAVEAGTR